MIFRTQKFDIGEIIRFDTHRGKTQVGVIENTGRKNYRVMLNDGRFYRVPIRSAQKWSAPFINPISASAEQVEFFGKYLVQLSKIILKQLDIDVAVKYRSGVWATYYKKGSHIQFGSQCVRYQFLNGRGSDAVSANINRFKLKFSLSSKLAVLVCHEVAHAVTDSRYKPPVRAHGKEFYHELKSLLDRYFVPITDKLAVLHKQNTGS
ncbi:MAG: hypothetical protein DWQ05_09450 [Calditrichaeota bacterium]|nr:MAG: hypothetical protein DWQ05_09450 [Calditrichota bacterium]